MSAIRYQQEQSISQEELLELYNNVGWAAYTAQPKQLERAIAHSLYVLTARDAEKLVGLLRTVGDGHTIVYIQDILVHTAHQRQGIGTALVHRVLEHFKSVRQKVLLTDDTPANRAFYESLGFRACDDGQLIAFVKLENQAAP